MTLNTEYYIDELGFPMADDTGIWKSEAGECFMCKEKTHRLDICYHTFFCNREVCNQAIEDDLKKLPESDLSDFG